ncbi:MAG: hypothetical protein HQ445_08825 [Polaromonas sp.]|nr:hypothetical protein [Polaromonas sp.]
MYFRLTIRQVTGCYLALALLMVPLLGLMHGIVHGFSHGPPTALSSGHGHQYEQPRAGLSPTGVADALFSSHGKAADCLVFDQLCHADALHFLPWQALPTLLPSILLVTLAGDFIARWAALYQARGPPSAR